MEEEHFMEQIITIVISQAVAVLFGFLTSHIQKNREERQKKHYVSGKRKVLMNVSLYEQIGGWVLKSAWIFAVCFVVVILVDVIVFHDTTINMVSRFLILGVTILILFILWKNKKFRGINKEEQEEDYTHLVHAYIISIDIYLWAALFADLWMKTPIWFLAYLAGEMLLIVISAFLFLHSKLVVWCKNVKVKVADCALPINIPIENFQIMKDKGIAIQNPQYGIRIIQPEHMVWIECEYTEQNVELLRKIEGVERGKHRSR